MRGLCSSGRLYLSVGQCTSQRHVLSPLVVTSIQSSRASRSLGNRTKYDLRHRKWCRYGGSAHRCTEIMSRFDFNRDGLTVCTLPGTVTLALLSSSEIPGESSVFENHSVLGVAAGASGEDSPAQTAFIIGGLILAYFVANWVVPMLITRNMEADILDSEVDVLDGLAAKSNKEERRRD